jgi:DNA-binding NarL/FixJ family response regulator
MLAPIANFPLWFFLGADAILRSTSSRWFPKSEAKAGWPMSLALEHAHIAVLSRHRYRAESVALAVAERAGCKARAFTCLDVAALAAFDTILVETSPVLEPDLSWVREITARCPDAKVILLGVVESENSVVMLAEAGASGYLAPGASFDDLMALLESSRRGEFTCPPHITFALFSHLAHLVSGATRFSVQSPVLTIRERKVVELLSSNLTNKEIAARLCISESTAKNHVQRILKKLGLHDRSLAAQSPRLHRPLVPPRISASATGQEPPLFAAGPGV